MRLRVRHLCLALIPIAALLYLAIGHETERHYCTACGLRRLTDFRTFLGFAGSRLTRYPETVFHRLLLTTGHIDCSHRWQAFYWNPHCIGPGEVHIPLVLDGNYWPENLLLVTRLKDPYKRAAILTSFDLAQPLEAQFQMFADTEPAFKELRTVPNAMCERDWWTKYRHLFVGRVPPHPALRRTRSTEKSATPQL